MQNSVKNENISQLTMSSPILSDTICQVCQDRSTGLHYGVYTCYPCRYFFKRYLVSRKIYECTGNFRGECIIDSTSRKQCPGCRLKRCFEVGMKRNAKSMPIPAAPHTPVDFTSVPPTYVPVVPPTVLLATSDSIQDTTDGTLPNAPQTTTRESVQDSAARSTSNGVEYIFAALQELESMPAPEAPHVPMDYGYIQPLHSLDSQAAQQYYRAQNLGSSQSTTVESTQDTAAGYSFNIATPDF